MTSATRQSGLVCMDQFEAQATWDSAAGESIVVQFQDDLLSKQKRKELTRFRSRTRTLVLRVPGCQDRQANIVGYNVPENAFYLSWLTPDTKARRTT
jgi:hypothetical protein